MLEEKIREEIETPFKKHLNLAGIKESISNKLTPLHDVLNRLGFYSVQPMGLEKWGYETGHRIFRNAVFRMTGSPELNLTNLTKATGSFGLYMLIKLQTIPHYDQILSTLKEISKKGINHFYHG